MPQPDRIAAAGASSASTPEGNAIGFLRRIGKVEAISFLVLLGIAMPLKYFADWPLGVKVVGWAHGVLFVVFIFALARARLVGRLSVAMAALAFVASLLPFGPFLIDERLARRS